LDVVGPYKLLEEPLYHLALIHQDKKARVAKAARYDAQRPGLTAFGLPFNDLFYIPELLDPPPPLARVASEDVFEIKAGLARECPNLPADAAAFFKIVSLAEVDATWASRPLRDGDLSGEIEVLAVDGSVRGRKVQILVAVTNRGSLTWPWGLHTHPEIRLTHSMASPERMPGTHPPNVLGQPTALPGPVNSGDRQLVLLEVEPLADGPLAIKLSLECNGTSFGSPTVLTVT